MNRYKRYNPEGLSLCLLQRAFGHRRHFDRLVRLLEALGKHCFKLRSDGVFAIGALRLLPLNSHFRTLRYSHLPDLIKCGAIEHFGFDEYGVEQFRIVGFLDYNLSAKHMDELRGWQREDWVERQRRHRAGNRSVTSSRDNVKAQQEENTLSGQNSASLSRCHAQSTKTTTPERVRSGTNDQGVSTREMPEVGSPRKSQKQTHQSPMTSIGATVEAFMTNATNDGRRNPLREISEEELAIADELADAGADAKKRRTQVSASEKFSLRLARKPATKTPLNLHHVEEAFRDVTGDYPRGNRASGLFRHLKDVIGIVEEDLGYAVKETRRQQSQKVLDNPVAYMLSIVIGQEKAKLGLTS